MVAHPHGVTFGQTVGELRHRPGAGAAGVAVQNGNNVHTDWRGYAVVPSRPPTGKCHYPRYGVDGRRHRRRPAGQTVIPGGGAVVMANYQTHIGNRCCLPCAMPRGRYRLAPVRGWSRRRRAAIRRAAWWPTAASVSQRCAAGGNPGGELDRQQPVAELHAAFSSSG